MLQLKSNFGLVLLTAGLLAPAASATTITFGTGTSDGFTSGGTPSVTVNNAAGVSGFNVIVTAGTTTTCSPNCAVTSSAAGYGVDSGTTDLDTTNINFNGGVIETLTISFSNSVTVTGITFGNWGGPDDVGIYNGGTLVTTYTANGATATVNTSGTSFQFRTTDSNDAFTLQSITFTIDAAPAPEPAAFGMMGVALLGLGFGARKKFGRG